MYKGSNPSIQVCSRMKRTGSAASWGAVRSPLVSAATAQSACERKVALAIGDIPAINGSLSKI